MVILSSVQVQDLYADGHEIASHTITHSFGTNFNEEKWANEVVGEAELLVRFGGVNPADIKGMRAPFLAVGGDKMFNMLSRYCRFDLFLFHFYFFFSYCCDSSSGAH